MKVKLNTVMAGPDGVRKRGDIINVNEKEGQALIDSGQAEAVEEKKQKPVERAQDAPQENASNPQEKPGARRAAGKKEKASE